VADDAEAGLAVHGEFTVNDRALDELLIAGRGAALAVEIGFPLAAADLEPLLDFDVGR